MLETIAIRADEEGTKATDEARAANERANDFTCRQRREQAEDDDDRRTRPQ